jgi:hypothetical protein
MNKFNAYEQAMREKKMREYNHNISTPKNPAMNIPKGKEKKEQMSLMFTPSHKKKARKIAKNHDMSVSELFAYWLEQYEN